MPNRMLQDRVVLAITLAALSSTAIASETAVEPSDRQVSYQRDIHPIFQRQCFGCHQGAKQLGEYRMTDFAAMLAGGETGEPAVVPGKPDDSYLINQITRHDGIAEMPKPPAKPLSDVEVELISRWIAQGATNDGPADDGARYDKVNLPQYTGPPALPSVDVSTDPDSGVTRVAVAGFHEIVVKDLSDGRLLDRYVGMSPRINSVRFSPDGKRIAAAGGTPGVNGELQVWDVGQGKLALSKTLTYDTLAGLSWSPDGSKIAFGASDNVVRAIDSNTGQQVLFQGAHEDWVRDTIFTADGSHLISVARDMSCKLTEVETERFVDNITSITPGALSRWPEQFVASSDAKRDTDRWCRWNRQGLSRLS